MVNENTTTSQNTTLYNTARETLLAFANNNISTIVLMGSGANGKTNLLNECKDDLYFFNETIIRYKLWPLSNNDVHGRIIEDKGVYWKVTQMFANKAFKYKDKGWPKPILLKDYV